MLPTIEENCSSKRRIYIYTRFFVQARIIKIREIKFIFRISCIRDVSDLFFFPVIVENKQMSRKVENENATYEKMLEQAEPRLAKWRNNTRKH